MSSERWWREMERVYAEAPHHSALGLQLCVIDAGEVRVDYLGAAAARNRRGTVSGGAVASMIDSAVCQAWRSLEENTSAVTIEMKVNFVRAADPGSLSTNGSLEHVGRTTAVGIGRTTDSDGRLIAIGLVTLTGARAPRSNERDST